MAPDALSFYRAARHLRAFGVPLLPRALVALGARLHGSYLDVDACIGEGVELGYGGMGVVVEQGVVVGEGSFLCQEVTLGAREGVRGVPRLGRNVMVGAGAKVLGPLAVGDNAAIGANALVVEDVPPGAVVAGIPARRLRTSKGVRAGSEPSRRACAHPPHAHGPVSSLLRASGHPPGRPWTVLLAIARGLAQFEQEEPRHDPHQR